MKQIDLFSAPSQENCKPRKSNTQSNNATVLHHKSGSKRLRLSRLDDFFDGELQYQAHFLSPDEAISLFDTLRQNLSWQSDKIKVYGKWHTIPRLQAWHGIDPASYRYSGKVLQPKPLTDELESLRRKCSEVAKVEFNSVLANLYRNGDDCMGMHSDDEPELGVNPVIASVTLGAIRRFDLLHKQQPVKLELLPGSGSLLLMKGATQNHWQHGIARIKRPVGERINLTFRKIVN